MPLVNRTKLSHSKHYTFYSITIHDKIQDHVRELGIRSLVINMVICFQKTDSGYQDKIDLWYLFYISEDD